MQRVAIARALANRPRLLLADEPTGELDQSTGEQIAALLDRVNADGTALVIVTHDVALARRAHRILTMRDGAIVERGAVVIAKLAMRSLFAHPVRSAVLAAGFGTGVSVMAILLGVAEVVLEQARSPVLVGGGDLVISGPGSGVTAARVLLSGALQTPSLAGRIRAASPWSETHAVPRAGGRRRRRWRRGVGFRASSARSAIRKSPA